MLSQGHFYALETGKSEDLAAFAHFFLTVTPYGHQKREWQKDLGGNTTKAESKPAEFKPTETKDPRATPTKPKDPKVDDDKKSVGGKSDKSKPEKDSKTDKDSKTAKNK